METILKAAAACSWVALVVLSLSPTGLRWSGDLGCAIAFFGAAAITRVAFRRLETRWQLTGFALAAAVLWSCEAWIGSQDVPVARWFASASGAFAGAVAARTVVHGWVWS